MERPFFHRRSEPLMIDELYALFQRNFPFVVREEAVARHILAHAGNHVIETRDEHGSLIGAAVVNENTILMLCVDQQHRQQGLGSKLLAEAEDFIQQGGHQEVVVGVGFDYLAPGVPTSKRYAPAVNECFYEGLDDTSSRFFERRGYVHSWDCNCFDMRFPLSEFANCEHRISDTIDGLTYRWVTEAELDAVCACVEDAWPEFVPYYRTPSFYEANGPEQVLIAVHDQEIAGALVVSLGVEGEGLGSVGCTAVRKAWRGRHIAVNLVTLGTAYLKDRGMREAYLGYTYSGLDHLYGYAGYQICTYYMMAKKGLTP